MRILTVDDDPRVLSLMRRGLTMAGYVVDSAEDGETALSITVGRRPDLVVLDVMLPGMNGFEVCRRLRSDDGELPILLLTAKDEVPDRVMGLDAGADDYLIKPFAFEELLARIRALLRRSHPEGERWLRFADLAANPATREVRRGSREVHLTAKEYDLLEFLIRHPKQVFSKDTIYHHVWGTDFFGDTNAIEVHVMRLRDKLEAGGEPRLLHTLRGAGYSLREG